MLLFRACSRLRSVRPMNLASMSCFKLSSTFPKPAFGFGFAVRPVRTRSHALPVAGAPAAAQLDDTQPVKEECETAEEAPVIFNQSRGATLAAAVTDEHRQVRAWLGRFSKKDIPMSALELNFSRSRGPGGQNVNKVNTKAEVRFVLDEARWLPPYTRDRLSKMFAQRLNKQGEFIVTSDSFRTQKQNLDDCFDKLYQLILEASSVPSETDPRKTERVQALAHEANERRIEQKRKEGTKKRRRMEYDD